MGAVLDSRTYLTDNKKTIFAKWHDDVQQSQYQNGTSYGGCIGMLGDSIHFVDVSPFVSQDEALDYISEHHRK